MGINLDWTVATPGRATTIIVHEVSSFESGLSALGLNDVFQHGVQYLGSLFCTAPQRHGSGQLQLE